MNQEIKLPPLPETEYLLGIPARPYESEWISSDSAWDDSAMQAYATAAVELDRAQRGEPVAWMVVNESGTDAFVTADPTLAQADQRALPLYTAPQPSQPAHTEAEVQELMEFAKHHALGTFSDATIEDNFRRILGAQKP